MKNQNNIVWAVLAIATVAISACAFIFFWKFTAEDAFIACRYAENFGDFGLLHFNIGEPLQAFTSPLQVLLQAVLYLLTGSSHIAWKVVGAVSWLLCVVLVAWACRREACSVVVVMVLLLLPPCAVLWAVGGLETPVLALWITCMAVLIKPARLDFRRLLAILLLAGLSFITRYDSVIFTIPVAAYALARNGNPRQILAACALAAIIPVGWLSFAWIYYGDIFPTSFYSKTPSFNLFVIVKNLFYVVEWLLLCGLVPLALLLAIWYLVAEKKNAPSFREIVPNRSSALAIGLTFLYTLTMATTHMMFCFRCFVPYLPPAALLIADAISNTSKLLNAQTQNISWHRSLAFCLALLLAFNVCHLAYTYHRSLNGLSVFVGEYRDIGVRSYAEDFLRILRLQAEEIKQDWHSRPHSSVRPPRIFTFAGGVLPHAYRSAYVYDVLVSYRHYYPYSVRWSSDYIHVLAPYVNPLEKQLPKPLSEYELVSKHEMIFDGSPNSFMVFYDPNPDPHTLPRRLVDTLPSHPLTQETQSASKQHVNIYTTP